MEAIKVEGLTKYYKDTAAVKGIPFQCGRVSFLPY